MALDLLIQWVNGFGVARGRTAQVMDDAPGVLLDADTASLVAIEWDARAHAVHLYGHPGHALAPRPPGGGAPQEVDDDQNEAGGDEKNGEGGGTYPASIDLSDSDAERRTLHVDPDTGLVTLSLIVPFASLTAPTFEAVIDDFIADMNLWSMLFAGEVLVPEVDVGSRDSGRDGGGRMPWRAILG